MFEIIHAQHTPKLPVMKDPAEWIKENKKLLTSFLKFASTHNSAVGLASNQVSLDGTRLKDRFIAIKISGKWMIAVNPRIRKRLEQSTSKIEGCLTWGNEKLIVAERSPSVDIDYYTVDGKYQKSRIVDSFEAQVWQHEINHIEGVKERIIDRNPTSQSGGHNKIGRDEVCPCGSGMKYKKCHYGLDISQFLV